MELGFVPTIEPEVKRATCASVVHSAPGMAPTFKFPLIFKQPRAKDDTVNRERLIIGDPFLCKIKYSFRSRTHEQTADSIP